MEIISATAKSANASEEIARVLNYLKKRKEMQ
jgi:hypothetical protein